jgi:hypothetical protein
MTVPVSRINLSYPKTRDGYRKYFRFGRTDSSTLKCVLPKGAIITSVLVTQDAAAVTGAGAINLGWSGATTALLNAFSLPTTSVGQAGAGAAAGSQLLAGTALTEDKQVICTYTVGSSTAGGTGFAQILFFLAGPGELIDD